MGRAMASDANQVPSWAWLSLDEGDNDLTRFLTYLVVGFADACPPASPIRDRLSQSRRGLRRALARECWLRSNPRSRRQPKRF